MSIYRKLISSLLVVLIAFAFGLATTGDIAEASGSVQVNGTLTYPGADHYAFVVTGADATSTLEFTHNCDTNELDPFMMVTDPNGSAYSSDDDLGNYGECGGGWAGGLITFAAGDVVDGVYQASAWSFDASVGTDFGTGSGPYTLTVTLTGPGTIYIDQGLSKAHIADIEINVAQAQPVYDGPASEIARQDGEEIWLPHDFDGSGYDTYIVTDTTEVDGVVWLEIYIGGPNLVWVPLVGVTLLSPLP